MGRDANNVQGDGGLKNIAQIRGGRFKDVARMIKGLRRFFLWKVVHYARFARRKHAAAQENLRNP